jgi:hypothetical protein
VASPYHDTWPRYSAPLFVQSLLWETTSHHKDYSKLFLYTTSTLDSTFLPVGTKKKEMCMNSNSAELSIKALWRHPFPFFPFFFSLFNSMHHTSRTLLYSGTPRTLTLQTFLLFGSPFRTSRQCWSIHNCLTMKLGMNFG